MYTFGNNVFYKKPNLIWEEHINETIFYYKEIYTDESLSIIEDSGRGIKLKINFTNLQMIMKKL